MTIVRKLLDLLLPHERRQAGLLLLLTLLMAAFDVLGIASIMPFVAVLTNPDVLRSSGVLTRLYAMGGFTNQMAFVRYLGLLMLGLLLLGLAVKTLTTYAQLRFIYLREYTIGRRLVEGYLFQPYAWFLQRHSADLGKTILSEVAQVINNAMMPTMLVLTQGAVALALLVLLFAVDPLVASVIGLALGLTYGAIYLMLRGYLHRIGAERLAANEARFEVLSEAFGGIKEVKAGGFERVYTGRFEHPAKRFATHQASALAIAQLPRFGLEALAFGGMLGAVLYLLGRPGGLQGALPVIALYAFAGYRLMPALQQVYGGFTQLRFAGPALHELHTELTTLQRPPEPPPTDSRAPVFALREEVTLRDVHYTYPSAPESTLRGLSLTIPACSTVGLVGMTGSGKTTTVDLILGLLEPDGGELAVDGVPITAENRRAWRQSIGYVPQQIFLADDTVAGNIAFGVSPELVDHAAVERAARTANLHDFVVGQLPAGYATAVGERGVRLSGGQRQRIGVARALYRQPRVLVLDEATSALDNLTEHAVIEAVSALSREITIIMIAHRLSTVRQCDRIYLLRRGRVAAAGTYDELTTESEMFRSMHAL